MREYFMSTDEETIVVDIDDMDSLIGAMRYKATHIKAKADPDIFSAVANALETNERLFKALLKDVNDYHGVICNYCLKDQTDKCISPDEAVLACGQFEWRELNHENTRKKREKYGEIRVKSEGETK